ncbi:MAG: single-stranded DNA-binding protein [Bacteroidota bacterium]
MATGTLNKVMLIGHTGDDVKMHYFDDKNCIGRFPVATNEEYTNKAGERISNTEWHNVVVRNKAAEICEKYLKKGDKVYIEGKIKTRKWQDDKGIDRYSTEIQCNEFTFLTPKSESNNSGTPAPQNQAAAQNNQVQQQTSKPETTPFVDEEEKEDDLPF